MRLIMYFDGACIPRNPGGRATYGFVVKDAATGVVLKTGRGVAAQEGTPLSTNNYGEYAGLLHGLFEAARILSAGGAGPHKLLISGDSRLVVEQVNGAWAANAPHLRPLCGEARGRIAEMALAQTTVTLRWIPREQNDEADELTKSVPFDAPTSILPCPPMDPQGTLF